jgi:hypothetical protein
MATVYNSSVTIVRGVADNALSVANAAQTDATQAISDASTALASATVAVNTVQRYQADQNVFYDTAPTASQLTGSKVTPILAKLTQARTWTFTLANLTGATPAYTYTAGTGSDLLKIINIGQQYALTLNLSNFAETQNYSYVVQPGESIVAFYNSAGQSSAGEWLFCASLV